MTLSHLYPLSQMEPQNKTEAGYRIEATKENFPLLNGMSFYRLVLYPNAVREPHWHANADELGYCLAGKILISLYGTGNLKQSFLVSEGEAFFIPSGTLHAIENVSKEASEAILQFSHEEPEDFGLSSVFGMFSNAVLGNTWASSSQVFQSFKHSTKEVFITLRKEPAVIPSESRYSSIYRFNLEGSSPLVANEGGTARVARENTWPILKRQALYSLLLTGEGMREPHWHPKTAEMGFVHKGKGRMSILSPQGAVDTYEMNEGDIYFIPKAYPHHIENLTTNPLHLLIFFDQGMPGDIGFTGSVKSYSNEVLTSVFNTKKTFFDSLPTYYQDLFIVKKTNPLD